MAIVVPNVGENIALEALVNKTAPQNPVLKLFKNNITPAETDVDTDYTEATFTGYSSITLTGSSWNAASAGSIDFAQQTFTSSADQTAESIYGYFVVQATSGKLMWSERFSSAPYTIENNGDDIDITPTITAD